MTGIRYGCYEVEAVESLQEEIAALKEVRGAGCQCGDDEACRFVRERDAANAALECALAGEATALEELDGMVDMNDALIEDNRELAERDVRWQARLERLRTEQPPRHEVRADFSWGYGTALRKAVAIMEGREP